MEPSDTKRQPPTYSSEPPPTYREITPPPLHIPMPHLQSISTRCSDTFTFAKGGMTVRIPLNKDYKLELYDNDERLHILLPEPCYMSMEVEELRKIRKRLETAVIKGELMRYWELDVAKNYEAKRGLIEAKLKNEYQNRLEQDEGFRRMEASKAASVISAELDLRVHYSISHW
ncbi:unnamed protein product [Fusarium fujikuroi]|uniref:Uncharacterized protein n=1 Tax=Fusarium fujikuroi TaxID=5127 RepID=A0A9Q9S4H0_FUSFU|nr:unnamed protein product [Fusarium fujikuroi]VTT82783.1 unnamed protein product [Fusarium fujikuroi]VZH91463.1 unnamed protein product [Fusarium fujikuroi]